MRRNNLHLRSGAPGVLRGLNTVRVLDEIRHGGPLARLELANLTGLSKPTVNEIVEVLQADGLVTEKAPGARAGARPGPRPRLVQFRAEYGYVIGIDIGANKLLGRLCQLDGEVVSTARMAFDPGVAADEMIEHLRTTVRNLIANAGVEAARVRAVVIGTPGVVDRETQVIRLAPQISGWEGLDLRPVLDGLLGCPVVVENEVHLSLLGERWGGAGKGDDDLVLVNVGIGIGAGILIDGEIYRGVGGAAGEIGYLPIGSSEDHDGSSPAMGPFERDAGGDAYARLGREVSTRPEGARILELARGRRERIDAEVIYAASHEGDPAAAEIIALLVERLARGVAAVATVLDPATIVIGGGLSRAGEGLMEPLRRYLGALIPNPPSLVPTTLGDEAVVIGAVVRAIALWEDDCYASIVKDA